MSERAARAMQGAARSAASRNHLGGTRERPKAVPRARPSDLRAGDENTRRVEMSERAARAMQGAASVRKNCKFWTKKPLGRCAEPYRSAQTSSKRDFCPLRVATRLPNGFFVPFERGFIFQTRFLSRILKISLRVLAPSGRSAARISGSQKESPPKRAFHCCSMRWLRLRDYSPWPASSSPESSSESSPESSSSESSSSSSPSSSSPESSSSSSSLSSFFLLSSDDSGFAPRLM